MRTLIAPLGCEVERELAEMESRLSEIARRYIRRLALEPYLGARLERGLLAEYGCRRIRFDYRDRPGDLFGAGPAKRRGDQDLGEGPTWRIVYWLPEASQAQVRLVVVLAAAPGHTQPGEPNAYELATRRLEALIGAQRKKEGSR